MKISSLIEQNLGAFSRSYTCSFNRMLYKGNLPKPVFRAYLENDHKFLLASAKIYDLVGSRLSKEEHAQLFRNCRKGIIELEQDIHKKHLKKLAPDAFFSPLESAQEIPVLAEYIAHLLYNAEHAPIEEAVASLIPCPFVYMGLGDYMDLSLCEPGHLYHDWIATYKDEQFRQSTWQMIEIADELNSSIACLSRQKSIAAQFWQSVEFEYRFFEEIVSLKPGEESNNTLSLRMQ